MLLSLKALSLLAAGLFLMNIANVAIKRHKQEQQPQPVTRAMPPQIVTPAPQQQILNTPAPSKETNTTVKPGNTTSINTTVGPQAG